jgi:hypothetical protein
VADGESTANRKNQRRGAHNFLAPDHVGHVDVDVDLAPMAANLTMMSMQARGHAVLGAITRTITEHSPGPRPPAARDTRRRRSEKSPRNSGKSSLKLLQIFRSTHRAGGQFFRGVIFSWDFFSVTGP